MNVGDSVWPIEEREHRPPGEQFSSGCYHQVLSVGPEWVYLVKSYGDTRPFRYRRDCVFPTQEEAEREAQRLNETAKGETTIRNRELLDLLNKLEEVAKTATMDNAYFQNCSGRAPTPPTKPR